MKRSFQKHHFRTWRWHCELDFWNSTYRVLENSSSFVKANVKCHICWEELALNATPGYFAFPSCFSVALCWLLPAIQCISFEVPPRTQVLTTDARGRISGGNLLLECSVSGRRTVWWTGSPSRSWWTTWKVWHWRTMMTSHSVGGLCSLTTIIARALLWYNAAFCSAERH